jgi:hypothetical protein
LISHVERNREAFGIDANNKISTSKSRSVGNYKEALERLTRPRYAPNPNGFKALYNRLEQDPYFQSILVQGPSPVGTISTHSTSKTKSSKSYTASSAGSSSAHNTTRSAKSQSGSGLGTGKLRGLRRIMKPVFRPIIWAKL